MSGQEPLIEVMHRARASSRRKGCVDAHVEQLTPSLSHKPMPFFSSPQQFSIHNSEFNEAHRDINKHVTKNYNHTINSNNIGSNNITGSNNTVGSNNRPPPNLSDYIPGYEQHLMRQWGGARREYGHPYSRPDQGRSYPYSRSEEGRRSRSYQPRDVSPIDSESESELPRDLAGLSSHLKNPRLNIRLPISLVHRLIIATMATPKDLLNMPHSPRPIIPTSNHRDPANCPRTA
ncbi:hypothetical protein BD779DRAFT_258990 [Infundibulicybe gibba]|nr:hypothetical protein BD779DRAFT_258990 [Infundibulicybe gibba]